MLSDLQKRCVDLCYHNKLTHVSSALNTVDVLGKIYLGKKENEPVILANCHASLALFVVLEMIGVAKAEDLIRDHGTHCHRDMDRGIWVSGGSLGQSETVALGIALANRKRKVWLVTSDGSCMEGATCEMMRLASKHAPNLIINVIFNGYGAFGEITAKDLPHWDSGKVIIHRVGKNYPDWLKGLPGHYLVLDPDQHAELMQ